MSQNKLKNNLEMSFDANYLIVPLSKEVVISYQRLLQAIQLVKLEHFYKKILFLMMN